jgi:hypothetical protein
MSHVSTGLLLFEEHERVPEEEFALQLEALSQMPEEEQMVIREALESLIIKYLSVTKSKQSAINTQLRLPFMIIVPTIFIESAALSPHVNPEFVIRLDTESGSA